MPYKDPEQAREAARRRYAANPEKKRVANKAYAKANPEKMRAATRRWREANPERIALYNRRRLARKAGVPSEPWVTRDVLERDGWQCRIVDCSCPDGRAIGKALASADPWGGVVDHIHPLSLGGHDTLDNVQAAHRTCNSAKGPQGVQH